MFNRPNESYSFDPKLFSYIEEDEANPLNRISKIIPDKAKVLDIGAGNGLLAHVLKQSHSDLIIDGIEPNTYATDLAKQHYRNFYIGYGQDFFSLIQQENYDFIILADVIEHMVDPLSFLQVLSHHVNSSTKVVISTPNVAFGAARIALMNGEFRYVDSGLLERTHVRFFTYETLLELGRKSGFCNLTASFFFRKILGTEIHIAPSLKNFFYLLSISGDELAHAYQFLLILSHSQAPSPDKITKIGHKTSVVIDFFLALLRALKHSLLKQFKGQS